MIVDIEHLRGWIGRTLETRHTVTPTLVEQFNATLGTAASAEPGAEAPLLVHLCLAQPVVAMAELGEDGHPAVGDFLPAVPLPRRMWAGGSFTFHAPCHVGEEVLRRSTIADVKIKEGRTGPLCFVTVSHDILVADRLIVSERQDIVYRDGASGSADKNQAPAPTGEHAQSVTPSPTLLFRYSALTFNGHRIHYDRPYATNVEGYPGLVVHGPLQATLLCHFAEVLNGRQPKAFSFRSKTPLFDGVDFTLNSATDAQDNSKLHLWTARPGGPIATQAIAEF